MPLTSQKIIDPLDSLDTEIAANPYPAYKVLREQAPVYFNESRKWWLISRYDDVSTALRHASLSQESKTIESRPFGYSGMGCPFSRLQSSISRWLGDPKHVRLSWFNWKAPAEHARMKGLFNAVFSTERVDRLRPLIESTCNRLLDKIMARGSCDVIADYGHRVAFDIMCHYFGFPEDVAPKIESWSLRLVDGFMAIPTEESQKRIDIELKQFADYFVPLVRQRRKQPQDDFLSDIIESNCNGIKLDDRQIAAHLCLFMFSAFDTTEALIGNATLALLQNRDQLMLLRDNPELIANAVEEFLRFDAPAQYTPGRILEPLELRGHVIKPGSTVHLLVGSANRDPDVFKDPDRLDIRRTNNKHLSFGPGAHFCVGAHVSRLETQIAISTIVQRIPDLRLAEDVSYKVQQRVRKPERLQVAF